MLRCVRARPQLLRNVNTIPTSASSAIFLPILLTKTQTRSTTSQQSPSEPRTYPNDDDSTVQRVTDSSQPPASFQTYLRPDPSAIHHTLGTFLQYATQKSVSRTSSTYHGTLYEYLTQSHLQSTLGFKLTRVGGRGDGGIDLLGMWSLPGALQAITGQSTTPATAGVSSHTNSNIGGTTSDAASVSHPIPVLIQCKRLTRGAGPNLIRELEGSFRGAPSPWRGQNALGIMVCTRSATNGAREAMGRSSKGLVWIMLEEMQMEKMAERRGRLDVKSEHANGAGNERDMHDGNDVEVGEEYVVPSVRVGQFLYNAAAAAMCGLEGVNVGTKYDDAGREMGVQLLWRGQPIAFG